MPTLPDGTKVPYGRPGFASPGDHPSTVGRGGFNPASVGYPVGEVARNPGLGRLGDLMKQYGPNVLRMLFGLGIVPGALEQMKQSMRGIGGRMGGAVNSMRGGLTGTPSMLSILNRGWGNAPHSYTAGPVSRAQINPYTDFIDRMKVEDPQSGVGLAQQDPLEFGGLSIAGLDKSLDETESEWADRVYGEIEGTEMGDHLKEKFKS